MRPIRCVLILTILPMLALSYGRNTHQGLSIQAINTSESIALG